MRRPPKLVLAITFLAASRLCARSSSIVAAAVSEDFTDMLTMSDADNNAFSGNSGMMNKDSKSHGPWLMGRSTGHDVPMGLCRTGGSGGRPTLIQWFGSSKCWPLPRALAGRGQTEVVLTLGGLRANTLTLWFLWSRSSGRTSRLIPHRGQTKMNRPIYEKRHDDEQSL
jgi:hypothetical protein